MNYLHNDVYNNMIVTQGSVNYPAIEYTDTLCGFITDVVESDINNYKTLVVFDLDRTVFRETKEKDSYIMFGNLYNYQYRMKIEQDAVKLINNLTKNADVIYLTARHFEYFVNLQQ